MKKKWLAVLTGLACCAVVFTGCTSVESGTVINKRHENAYDSTYIHNVAACPEEELQWQNMMVLQPKKSLQCGKTQKEIGIEWEVSPFGQARQSWDTRLFLSAKVGLCMSAV